MIRSGFLLSLSVFCEKILSFLVVVVAARLFGDAGMGEFYFYFSLVSLAIPLMDVGFEKLYLLNESAQRSPGSLLTQLFATKILMGGATITTLLLFSLIIPGMDNTRALLACFIAIFSDELGQLVRSPARVREQHLYEIVAPFSARLTTFLLLVGFYGTLESGYQVAYCYASANLIVAVASYFTVEEQKFDWRALPSFQEAVNWVKLGLPFSLTHLFVMINLFADSVILGSFSLQEVGWYNVAYRIILVLGALSFGACHVLFPRLRAMKEAKSHLERRQLLRDMLRLFLLVFGAAAILASTIGAEWLPLLYGPEFADSAYVFRLLAPLICLIAFTNIMGQSLEALGYQETVWRVNMAAAGLNVFLNLLVIPSFLAAGAACTTVFTEIFILLLLFGRYRNILVTSDGWYTSRIVLYLGISLMGSVAAWTLLPLSVATLVLPLFCGGLFFLFSKWWLPTWNLMDQSKGEKPCVS